MVGRPWWSTSRFYVAVTAAACALAVFFFFDGYPTLIYDSLGYYFLANVLRDHGLSAWPTDLRTYGYAFFLALVSGFRRIGPEESRFVAFWAQLAIYLGACAWVGRRLSRVLESPGIGALAYAIGALNPILLLHASEVLTDQLSAVLILLSVALSWKAPGPEQRGVARDVGLSFFCAAGAVAVRPANVVVLPALALVWVLRALRWRDLGWRAAIAALVGVASPLVPQVIINHRAFGTLNPLIEHDLYRQQTGWGMSALKYATLVVPDRSPFLVYVNPFYRGDSSPAAFLRHHPIHYLLTLGLHGFGLLDQDLPFTYVTDLHPWYRWPMAVLNFLLLYAALVGAAAGLVRIFRRRQMDEATFVPVSALLVAGAYAAIYLPVEVEGRFGLALLALAIPLAAAAFRTGATWRRSGRGRVLLGLGAVVCVAAACSLSAWLSTTRTNPAVDSPANPANVAPKAAAAN